MNDLNGVKEAAYSPFCHTQDDGMCDSERHRCRTLLCSSTVEGKRGAGQGGGGCQMLLLHKHSHQPSRKLEYTTFNLTRRGVLVAQC